MYAHFLTVYRPFPPYPLGGWISSPRVCQRPSVWGFVCFLIFPPDHYLCCHRFPDIPTAVHSAVDVQLRHRQSIPEKGQHRRFRSRRRRLDGVQIQVSDNRAFAASPKRNPSTTRKRLSFRVFV